MAWYVVGRPEDSDSELGKWEYAVKEASSASEARRDSIMDYITVRGPFTEEVADAEKSRLDAREEKRKNMH